MNIANLIRTSISTLVAGFFLALTACGGGGTTSGMGGGGMGGASLFAGTYSGNRSVAMSPGMPSGGGMFSQNLQISNQGQLVSGLNFGAGVEVQCSESPPIDIPANGQFSSSFIVNCNGSGLVDCEVHRDVSGAVVGNMLSVAAESTFHCANGDFTTQSSFEGNR